MRSREGTEADAQAFYNSNKERIDADFAQVKAQVIQYLQGQENEKAVAAYAARLRQGASVETFLVVPEPPVYNIPVDDQPAKGSMAAKVTIIEFTDYQCPACARAQPVIERVARNTATRACRRPRLSRSGSTSRLQGRRGRRGRA